MQFKRTHSYFYAADYLNKQIFKCTIGNEVIVLLKKTAANS